MNTTVPPRDTVTTALALTWLVMMGAVIYFAFVSGTATVRQLPEPTPQPVGHAPLFK